MCGYLGILEVDLRSGGDHSDGIVQHLKHRITLDLQGIVFDQRKVEQY